MGGVRGRLVDDGYLMSEIDSEKNDSIDISNITLGSQIKLWWKCEWGHSWQMAVVKRSNGQKCPYCSGKRTLRGYNDLATTNPELVSEWDYDRNDFQIYEYRRMSNKKVWWKCSKGHSWEAVISKRVLGEKCPICQGKRVLKGFNDISTTHPKLIQEWDYEKNIGNRPSQYSKGSDEKVWWRCRLNHSWRATISSRVSGVGCPQCARELQSSFPEKAIYYYLKRVFPDAISGYRTSNLFEIDIFIPSLQVGIEYDGERWHKDFERDLKKNQGCAELNITLIRVREPKCPLLLDGTSINILMNSKKGLCDAIDEVFEKIAMITGKRYSGQVDLVEDSVNILSLLVSSDKNRSFEVTYPDIAKEWDWEKNGKLTPKSITAGSEKKVWWICPRGHSYLASISARVRGRGCSTCAGKTVLKGFNDFESCCPHLVGEWDYIKNKTTPDKISYGSDRKCWWICDKGHSYECSINNRRSGQACCYCSGKKVLKGFNDISTTHPDVALQWDGERNDILPYEVSFGSHKKVWWKCCECGHQWQSSVYNRCLNGSGCPKCSGRNNNDM